MNISWTISLEQVNLDIYKWSLHNYLMEKKKELPSSNYDVLLIQREKSLNLLLLY